MSQKVSSVKRISLIILLLVFSTVTLFICSVKSQATDYEPVLSEINLQDNYYIDTDFVAPEASITVNGESKTAKASVSFPDKRAYQIKSKIELDQLGEYTLVYSADFGGVTYEVKKTFSVISEFYSLVGNDCSAQYSAEMGGIDVNLAKDGVFKLNKIVNLSENTKDDVFFSCYVVAKESGKGDFQTLVLTLTDVEDPQVTLNYKINITPFNHDPSVSARRTSYVKTSIGDTGIFFGKDSGGTIHKGNSYGTGVRFSFSNRAYINKDAENNPIFIEPKDDQWQMMLDFKNQEVFTRGTANLAMGGKVMDYKDKENFPDINGIGSGKYYLSLTAQDYATSSAKIVITDVNGMDLNGRDCIDNEAPIINIDYGSYDEATLPNGIVGENYKIFNAKAIDDYGVKNFSKRVYFNYYSDKKVTIPTTGDSFSPLQSGIYTIEYKAEDKYGNISTKDIQINVVASADDLTISASKAQNAIAATELTLPLASVGGAEGFGDAKVTIVAKIGVEVVNVTDNKFVPMSVGDWKIIYTVEDFLGRTATCETILTVTAPTAPVFISTAENALPHYFIVGNTYVLPQVMAVDFSGDVKQEVKAQIKILDGTQELAITDNKFTPQGLANGKEIKVVYSAGASKQEYTKTVVDIKTAGKLDMTKLFVTEGSVTPSSDNTSISYNFATQAKFEYANKLVADDFKFEFDIASLDGCGMFSLCLTDSQNPAQKLQLDFSKTAMKMTLSNGRQYKLNDTRISIRYDGSVKLLQVNNNIAIKLTNILDEFKGFSSNYIYFNINFENVTSDSAIKMFNICGQPLSAKTEDAIAPILITYNDEVAYYEVNQKAKIGRAVASDVIEGEKAVYVTVIRADGAFAKSDDNVELNNVDASKDYFILLKDYDTYFVTYTAADAKQSVTEEFSINALDRVAPIITIQNKNVTESVVGKQIDISSAIVTDNSTTDIKCLTIIIDNLGNYSFNTTQNFTPTSKGEWTIRYFAIDEAGNIQILDCKIMVKE